MSEISWTCVGCPHRHLEDNTTVTLISLTSANILPTLDTVLTSLKKGPDLLLQALLSSVKKVTFSFFDKIKIYGTTSQWVGLWILTA